MPLDHSTLQIVVLVILTWWIVRMVRPRHLAMKAMTPAFAFLCLMSMAASGAGLASVHDWRPAAVGALSMCLGTLVVAGLAGLVRARTVRLWRDPQGVMRQGTAVTVIAWLAWVAVHYGLDRVINAVDPASRLAQTTLWSGLAISLAVQGWALRRRAAVVAAGAVDPAPARAATKVPPSPAAPR